MVRRSTWDHTDEAILNVIKSACEDTYFTSAQAKVLLLLLHAQDKRIQAVRSLYARIVDEDKRDRIFASVFVCLCV